MPFPPNEPWGLPLLPNGDKGSPHVFICKLPLGADQDYSVFRDMVLSYITIAGFFQPPPSSPPKPQSQCYSSLLFLHSRASKVLRLAGLSDLHVNVRTAIYWVRP